MLKLKKIDDFIKAIKQLFTSFDNIHSLYGKITKIIQKPNETVLTYANQLQELVLQIKEMKKLEEGVTDDIFKAYETEVHVNALKNFKQGLQQDI